MANNGIKNKIFSINPHIEVFFRKAYWKNVNLLSKYVKKKRKRNNKKQNNSVDFDKIINALKNASIDKGALLVVHSAYGVLKNTGLSPTQIIDKLLGLVGPNGTIAMNCARIFPEEQTVKNYSRDDPKGIATYNMQHSKVWTGAIAQAMIEYPNAVISKFPINSMGAVGKLAGEMMHNNLCGDTACGINSSWKFCVDNNATIVSIGTDLTHSLTMIHVAEDDNPNWPVKDWYRKREYKIIDNDEEIFIEVKERRPKWGTLHFGERTLCKDLLKNGLMKSFYVDNVLVEILHARSLIDFLYSKNSKGYPYFGIKKYLRS